MRELTSKDGGHAFPNITPDMMVMGGPGMTLRDYFAGQAIAGILAQGFFRAGNRDDRPVIAANSYYLADAMLRERKKEK